MIIFSGNTSVVTHRKCVTKTSEAIISLVPWLLSNLINSIVNLRLLKNCLSENFSKDVLRCTWWHEYKCFSFVKREMFRYFWTTPSESLENTIGRDQIRWNQPSVSQFSVIPEKLTPRIPFRRSPLIFACSCFASFLLNRYHLFILEFFYASTFSSQEEDRMWGCEDRIQLQNKNCNLFSKSILRRKKNRNQVYSFLVFHSRVVGKSETHRHFCRIIEKEHFSSWKDVLEFASCFRNQSVFLKHVFLPIVMFFQLLFFVGKWAPVLKVTDALVVHYKTWRWTGSCFCLKQFSVGVKYFTVSESLMKLTPNSQKHLLCWSVSHVIFNYPSVHQCWCMDEQELINLYSSSSSLVRTAWLEHFVYTHTVSCSLSWENEFSSHRTSWRNKHLMSCVCLCLDHRFIPFPSMTIIHFVWKLLSHKK